MGPKIGPKRVKNALFPLFSELFLIFLLKYPSKLQIFTMGHNLKFPAKKRFFSRFTPICWGIFHKLPLNNMLKSRKVEPFVSNLF